MNIKENSVISNKMLIKIDYFIFKKTLGRLFFLYMEVLTQEYLHI